MGLNGLSLMGAATPATWTAKAYGQVPQGYTGAADSLFASDSAQVSSSARERYEAASLLDSVASMEGLGAGRRYKTLAQVGADLAEDLSAFQQTFTSFMSQAGIDTGQELVLQGDGQGHVMAVNDHPDSGQVNRFFNHNNPMVARFMVAAARASLVEAGQNTAFSNQYENDPVGAIKNNIDQLKEKMLSFQMHFGTEGFSTSFAPPIAK